MQHEEEILRNPFSVRCWLRYAQARQKGPRHRLNLLFERALRELPGRWGGGRGHLVGGKPTGGPWGHLGVGGWGHPGCPHWGQGALGALQWGERDLGALQEVGGTHRDLRGVLVGDRDLGDTWGDAQGPRGHLGGPRGHLRVGGEGHPWCSQWGQRAPGAPWWVGVGQEPPVSPRGGGGGVAGVTGVSPHLPPQLQAVVPVPATAAAAGEGTLPHRPCLRGGQRLPRARPRLHAQGGDTGTERGQGDREGTRGEWGEGSWRGRRHTEVGKGMWACGKDLGT